LEFTGSLHTMLDIISVKWVEVLAWWVMPLFNRIIPPLLPTMVREQLGPLLSK
jgi:hypothetical protein